MLGDYLSGQARWWPGSPHSRQLPTLLTLSSLSVVIPSLIVMEGSRERSDRRQSGGSIWSGLKQMFNNKPSPGPPGQAEAGQKKIQHSAYSYSCLGNSSRRTDEDMYEGPTGSQALSRNISYSHESVFQMDPYVVQVRFCALPFLSSVFQAE